MELNYLINKNNNRERLLLNNNKQVGLYRLNSFIFINGNLIKVQREKDVFGLITYSFHKGKKVVSKFTTEGAFNPLNGVSSIHFYFESKQYIAERRPMNFINNGRSEVKINYKNEVLLELQENRIGFFLKNSNDEGTIKIKFDSFNDEFSLLIFISLLLKNDLRDLVIV